MPVNQDICNVSTERKRNGLFNKMLGKQFNKITQRNHYGCVGTFSLGIPRLGSCS